MSKAPESQTAAPAAPAPAKAKKVKEAKPAVVKDTANGVTRPKAGTATGTVWAVADEYSQKAGKPASRKDVLEECAQKGINPATTSTQYGRWRKYHGLKGRDEVAEATA